MQAACKQIHRTLLQSFDYVGPLQAEPAVPPLLRVRLSQCSLAHAALDRSPPATRQAIVWGLSVKHTPQRCGLAHCLSDEDVIQVVKKRNQKELDPHNQKKGPVEKSRNQIKKAKASLKT